MKTRILLFVTVLFFSIMFMSCIKDDNEPPYPNENEQTLFIHMPWSSNLTSHFEQNLRDFETAIKSNILKNNRVIVFFSSSPTDATLFELKYENGSNTRETIKTYNNPAYTTTDGITAILNDVKNVAPAKRYAMVIGCHGVGWLPVVQTKALRSAEKYHWEYEDVPLTRFFGGTAGKSITLPL